MHAGPRDSCMHRIELTIVGRSELAGSGTSPCVAAQVSFARGLGTRTSSFLSSPGTGPDVCPSAAKHQGPDFKGNNNCLLMMS